MTNDEVKIAIALLLKIIHNIDNNVTWVGDGGVRGIDEKAQVMNVNVNRVGDMTQTIADDDKDVKATATTLKSIVRQTADDVDDLKRNQIRETLENGNLGVIHGWALRRYSYSSSTGRMPMAEHGSHSIPLHLEISHQEPVASVVRVLFEHGAEVGVEDDKLDSVSDRIVEGTSHNCTAPF